MTDSHLKPYVYVVAHGLRSGEIDPRELVYQVSRIGTRSGALETLEELLQATRRAVDCTRDGGEFRA